MEIRRAQKNDCAGICSLVNNELGYPDVTVNELASRMEMMEQDNNYCTFVALVDDKIVGFIGTVQGIAFEINSGFMRIIALAVAKEFQNKGVGGSLLKYAENLAVSKGITAFALNSGFRRLDAHEFYERHGYLKKSYGFSKDIVAI